MNQIKFGAVIGYFSIALNFTLALFYTPWLLRQIGISDYGLYSLSAAFMSYFLLDFGLGQAMGRFLSMAVAKGDQDQEREIMGTGLRIYLIIDAIICICLIISFIFISEIFVKLTPEEIEKFKVVFAISAVCSLFSFPLMPVSGVIMAHQKFIFLKSLDLFYKLLSVGIIVVLLYHGGKLYALVITNGIVGVFVSILKLLYVRNKLHVKYSLRDYDRSIAKSLFKFSFWVCVILIAQRFVVNISPTILGMRASTKEISVFSLATTLEANIWMFSSALNGLFLPKVTNLSLKDTAIDDITNLMIKVGRIQLQLCGLVISGVIVFGLPFMRLWMGENFINSYWIVVMMIVTGLVTYTQSIAESLLFVKNELRYRAITYIGAGLVSCFLSYILTPKYGALACGMSILFVNLIFHTIGVNLIYKYRLKLPLSKFFLECHCKILMPLLFLIFLTLFMQQFYVLNSWFSLCVAIVFYVFMYAIVFWFLVMNKTEKNLFIHLLK